MHILILPIRESERHISQRTLSSSLLSMHAAHPNYVVQKVLSQASWHMIDGRHSSVIRATETALNLWCVCNPLWLLVFTSQHSWYNTLIIAPLGSITYQQIFGTGSSQTVLN